MNKSSISLTGLTLTELIVVIIIIGILVTLALPQFGATRERAIVREAVANLRLIAAAERIYRMERGVYYPGDLTTQTVPDNINTWLKLDLTAANWDYVVSGGAGDFTADADRTTGNFQNCVYRVTYDPAAGIDTTNNPQPVVVADCPPP